MMPNLIDALISFGNPVGQLVGIMAIAAIAVVGDAVVRADPPTRRPRPDAPVPNE
jgi:hypothetical protein